MARTGHRGRGGPHRRRLGLRVLRSAAAAVSPSAGRLGPGGHSRRLRGPDAGAARRLRHRWYRARPARRSPTSSAAPTPHGFDCSGLVQYVFALNGLGLPRVVRDQYRYGEPVKLDQLEPGDLVFFETAGRRGKPRRHRHRRRQVRARAQLARAGPHQPAHVWLLGRPRDRRTPVGGWFFEDAIVSASARSATARPRRSSKSEGGHGFMSSYCRHDPLDRPLVDLLSAFSDPTPTPGGGSASALAAALGLSLARDGRADGPHARGIRRRPRGAGSREGRAAAAARSRQRAGRRRREGLRRGGGGVSAAEGDRRGEGRTTSGRAKRAARRGRGAAGRDARLPGRASPPPSTSRVTATRLQAATSASASSFWAPPCAAQR